MKNISPTTFAIVAGAVVFLYIATVLSIKNDTAQALERCLQNQIVGVPRSSYYLPAGAPDSIPCSSEFDERCMEYYPTGLNGIQ